MGKLFEYVLLKKTWLQAELKILELCKDEDETIEVDNDPEYYKGTIVFLLLCFWTLL